MDALPIPAYDIVQLNEIAPGVTGIRTLFVNVYAIQSAPGTPHSSWTLIDSGIPMSHGKIKKWIESQFGEGARPAAIVLTHGHFDHIGSIQSLLEDWDVPVYAHRDELRFLTGADKYPPPDPGVGGGLMALMSPLYPRGSADISGHVHALPSDRSVPTLPGWKWFHTPGHAPGHISLFREADRVLVVGDAFCTTKQESFMSVAQQKPELTGPPAYYTPDWDAAHASVELLAQLAPTTVAPGHGMPMRGADVPQQIRRLAADFNRIAVPEHGKYVDPKIV